MSEQYTPFNKPAYPWVNVKDRLPVMDSPVLLAVWKQRYSSARAIAFSTCNCRVQWKAINYQVLNDGSWYVTHWQYSPEFPE